MKYAVIKLAGKQYKVSEGDIFELERQENLDFEVLMLSDEGKVQIGTPVLKDIKISAAILDNKLGDKINVSRYRSKSRYRKNKGHRQPLSVVKIEKIGDGKEKAIQETTENKKTVKSEKAVKSEKKVTKKRTKKEE